MADIRFNTDAAERACTEQPHLTGTFERGMNWGFGPSEVLLDAHDDLLRVDSRTQRIAVRSGDLALVCTRIDYSEWSGPHGPEDMHFRQGRVGVEITRGQSVVSAEGVDWVPDSPVIVKFMGRATAGHWDRTLDHNKRVGLIGAKLDKGFGFGDDEVEPARGYSDSKDEDDFIHPQAESIFAELAGLMPKEVSMEVGYAVNNDIVIRNISGVGAPADIRVIALATNK